jgi:electron transfer flavoprotein alpha subunit
MTGSGCVVAINRDAEAPNFEWRTTASSAI